MILRPCLLALASLASLSLSPPQSSLTQPAVNPCSYGVCFGEFNTPGLGNGNLLSATFTRADGTSVVFNVEAHTHNLPDPDPQHRAGILHGFLYYGAPGGTPDFVLYGHWDLEKATGNGHFYAPIYPPDSVLVEAIGRMGGTLFEPPGDPTPSMGSFVGQWGMCL
jgi:hypothetical protein